MYIKEVGIEYRIEMTLYDSFRLLTPVGIQESFWEILYGKSHYKLKTNKKKISVYPRGKYKLVPNSRNIVMSGTY